MFVIIESQKQERYKDKITRRRKFHQRTGASPLKTSLYKVDVFSHNKKDKKIQRKEINKDTPCQKQLFQMPTMPNFQQFFSTKYDSGWTDQIYNKIVPDDIDQWVNASYEEDQQFF